MPMNVEDILAVDFPSAEDLRRFVDSHGGCRQARDLLLSIGEQVGPEDGAPGLVRMRRVLGLLDRLERLSRP